MDTGLSWQSHIKPSSSWMNSALIQLARIKHLILRSDLRHAIQARALNHLHYCTLVWSTAGTSATAPIRRSLQMAECLACFQFKDLNQTMNSHSPHDKLTKRHFLPLLWIKCTIGHSSYKDSPVSGRICNCNTIWAFGIYPNNKLDHLNDY